MRQKVTDDGISFWGVTLLSLAGPAVWTAHFGLIYGVQHVMCATGAPGGAVVAFVIAMTLIAACMLLPACFWPVRLYQRLTGRGLTGEMRSFLAGVMRVLTILSLCGILWAGAAALFLPACPPLR